MAHPGWCLLILVEDEIRALENQSELDESITIEDHNAHHKRDRVTRRMSVRSVRSVVDAASPLD